MTNQAGIEKGKTKFTELKSKFESMTKELDIPIYILIATGETHYRKRFYFRILGLFSFANLKIDYKVNLVLKCGIFL